MSADAGGKSNRGNVSSRILIVDDDELLRQMLWLAFVRLGHEPVDVARGKSAISVHEKYPAALAVVDQAGLEIIGPLRRRNPQVKIIAMSGGGRTEAGDFHLLARLKGADCTMMKPFSVSELEAAVNTLLAPPADR